RHGGLYARKGRPASFRDADWSSVGMLPAANADREARFLVFTGRTGRWKGIFAVHSWVVFKTEHASSWSRYDVVGWGQPVRNNGWARRGLQLQQFRRLSHLARAQQQHLHRDRAARRTAARDHAARERGGQGFPSLPLCRPDR